MTLAQPKEFERSIDDKIEILLNNWNILVGDAAELADLGAEMDEEEQVHHRSISMQIWGMRMTLGELYRARRLTSEQVDRLAYLDRMLLEEATQIEIAYGPSLAELVEDLLAWGTPLTTPEGTVRLDVPLRTLPTPTDTLAPVGVDEP